MNVVISLSSFTTCEAWCLGITFSTSTALTSLERASQCFGSDACPGSDVLPLKQSDTQLNTVVFRAVYKLKLPPHKLFADTERIQQKPGNSLQPSISN